MDSQPAPAQGAMTTSTGTIRARLSHLPVRQIQLAIGLIISGVALYVALSGVDWGVAKRSLQEATYPLLIPAVVAMVTALLLRAVRWRLLFHPQAGLGLGRFYGVLNVGYMVNNIFPFQIGDLVRAYLLGQFEGLRKSRTFPTVLIERVADILVLFALLMVLIPFVPMPAWAAIPVAAAAGAVVVIGTALVFMAGNREMVLRLLETPLRLLPGRWHDNARDMAQAALDGLAVLRRPRILALVVGWTAASWLTTALVLYFTMLGFDLDVPFSAAIFIVVVTSFGFFVPSSPGALGVYHAISIESLVRVFGIERGLAASYSMVAYLIFYLPPVLIGILFLWREHLSLRQLRELATQQGEDIPEDEVDAVASGRDEAERLA